MPRGLLSVWLKSAGCDRYLHNYKLVSLFFPLFLYNDYTLLVSINGGEKQIKMRFGLFVLKNLTPTDIQRGSILKVFDSKKWTTEFKSSKANKIEV